MPEQLKSYSGRYALLAIWFAVAIAFQLTVSSKTMADLWADAQHFRPALLPHWFMDVTLEVLTPTACLLLGFYVAAVRIWDARAWLLLTVLVSFSVLADGSDWPDQAMRWETPLRHLVLAYRSALMGSWPVWLMVFALYFPSRANYDTRHPAFKWILLGPAIGASLATIILRVVANETGDLLADKPPFADTTHILLTSLFWVGIGFFLLVLSGKLRASNTPDECRRLRILLLGLACSFVPAFGLSIVAGQMHMQVKQFPLWTLVPIYSLVLLFPLTLAYVTVVDRALDTRALLRQSLQYALARRGVVVLQMLVGVAVILLVAMFSGGVPFLTRATITAIGIGVIPLIGIAGRRTARWIDKQFFREAYNAERLLTSLADSVSTMVELGPLSKTVSSKIAEALHVKEIALFLREQNLYRVAYAMGYAHALEVSLAQGAGIVQQLEAKKSGIPVYMDTPKSWTTTDPRESSVLRQLNTQLLLPIARRDELLGFFSLGGKSSEAPYSPSDIQLLETVASQTALAVENSSLSSAIASETAQREVLEREISIARDVQQGLFPQIYPAIPGLAFWGTCRPAREVGGDYYDFLGLPNQNLGLAVGDISGKGIPASLLMANLQASLRAQTLTAGTNLEEMISNVNRLVFAASPVNRYATFFYAQYESATRRLRYVNAGHNAPIVLRNGSGSCELIRLDRGGPPVGLLAQASYESCELELFEGDLLVLFTDGITEAMNLADEEWGEEGLTKILQSSNGAEPQDLAQEIFRAADSFTGTAPQHDDMTVVVVRVGGETHAQLFSA